MCSVQLIWHFTKIDNWYRAFSVIQYVLLLTCISDSIYAFIMKYFLGPINTPLSFNAINIVYVEHNQYWIRQSECAILTNIE